MKITKQRKQEETNQIPTDALRNLEALRSKAFLQRLNGGNIGLECQSQDIVVNGGVKQGARNYHSPSTGTSKCRYSHSRVVSISIVLKVHKSLWEYEHVPSLKVLSEELIGSVHKPYLKGTASN